MAFEPARNFTPNPQSIASTPAFHQTAFIALGHILTHLTAAKEELAFVTNSDVSIIALGIPEARKEAAGDKHMQIFHFVDQLLHPEQWRQS
ncbi:MAG: hypothetical protein M1835_006192 [Candelina submexicana]|nr:MAG: hypothetical protein M1835_006192 [Candelina submexicana]